MVLKKKEIMKRLCTAVLTAHYSLNCIPVPTVPVYCWYNLVYTEHYSEQRAASTE